MTEKPPAAMTTPVAPLPEEDHVELLYAVREYDVDGFALSDDEAIEHIQKVMIAAERRGRESAAAENQQLQSVLAKTSAALLDAIQDREKLRKLDMEALEKLEEQAEAAQARIEALEGALRWFLADERFQVAVGGNPNVVDKMLDDARAILTAQERGGDLAESEGTP